MLRGGNLAPRDSSNGWPPVRGLQRLYRLLRPALFLLPAETAHDLGLALLRLPLGDRRWRPPEVLRQHLLGRDFASPVGLAAGFDKDARRLPGWRRLGFGFAEVGTVTPLPQDGNPKPRLYRLASERSLQNWMGFNGSGADFVRRRLQARPADFPLGVNIGKNAATPIERAVDDYRRCAATLAQLSDFLVLNVSSPNTRGLRTLQTTHELRTLLAAVREESGSTPVLTKLSPDEELADLQELAAASVDLGASGVVITNTSVDYSIRVVPTEPQRGGLSGRILRERSRQVTAAVGAAIRGRGTVVSVGGIDSADEAWRRIRDGAALIEIFTGLVYEGPGLPMRLAEEIAERMQRTGVKQLSEVAEAGDEL